MQNYFILLLQYCCINVFIVRDLFIMHERLFLHYHCCCCSGEHGVDTAVQHPWLQICLDRPLPSNDAYRNKRAARCINSLFDVCCIFLLLWSALYLARFLLLINIILALKRLELNAFFCMNNAGKRHVVFHVSFPRVEQLSEVDGPKSLSWESAVRWTAKQNKRLFCWKRQSGDKLWTTHYTEVALCRAEKHNQTLRMDLWGNVGRC